MNKKMVDSIKLPVFMSEIWDTSQKVDCQKGTNLRVDFEKMSHYCSLLQSLKEFWMTITFLRSMIS